MENNHTTTLRESIAHFRNLCQHQSMSLLENVFKYLIKENNKQIASIEDNEGVEKLQRLLADNDEASALDTAIIQEGEASPEELILLANCDVQEIAEKNRLLPRINFFVEVCRIILDTVRQNSRLMDLYNSVAVRLFEFCERFGCHREYRKLSDTLAAHFQ